MERKLTDALDNDGPPIRVLIVEDRPVARKLLEAELVQAHGIEIAGIARDGEEAIEQVQEIDPDIVLMDVVMPGMDGIEALTRIREFSDVPVILLTGAKVATESLEHVARKKGADGFFIKPSGSVSVDLYSISEPLIAEIRKLAKRERTT